MVQITVNCKIVWNPYHLRSFSLLSAMLLLPLLLSAQMEDIDTELWWGSKEKAPSGSYLTKIIAAGDWGAYLLRYRPSRGFSREQTWLEEFDSRYALRARRELNAAREGDELEDVVALRGQMYVITTRTVGDAAQAWVRPLNPSGQVTGTEKLLAELEADEKFRRRQFDLEYSRDSSYLLVYNQLPPEKDGPERFSLRVFKDDFSLLWSRDVTLPYRDKSFSIRSYQVDAEGNVYLLCQQRAMDQEDRTPPLYIVYAYRRDGREEVAYQLEIDGIDFSNLRFEVAGNGDLVCAGFYSTPDITGSLGIGHVRIDPITKEAKQVDLLPFPTDFLEEVGQTVRKGAAPTLLRYRLRDLTLRSDGGIVLVAEQFFRQERVMNMSPLAGPQMNIYDHYNDIIVANIAPDGTYTWLRRIPKRQQTPDDGGAISSFAQATVQDRFLFFYNDHPDNFRPGNERLSPMEGRDAVLTVTEIRRDGKLNTVPLYVNGDAQVTAQPRRCRQIGARLVLVYGENGREYRLGLLKME
jgi:hypothetical protein